MKAGLWFGRSKRGLRVFFHNHYKHSHMLVVYKPAKYENKEIFFFLKKHKKAPTFSLLTSFPQKMGF